MRRPVLLSTALCAMLSAGPAAAAQPLFATEQVNLDPPAVLGLNGSSQQRLAQTFRLPRDGVISHLTLPLNCNPRAEVRVTLETVDGMGRPSGVVLAEEVVPGKVFSSVPTPAIGFRLVQFRYPPKLPAATYAFTLTAKGGDCGAYVSPADRDYYGDGGGWFEALPNPPGWYELFDAAGRRDLAFQVFMRH